MKALIITGLAATAVSATNVVPAQLLAGQGLTPQALADLEPSCSSALSSLIDDLPLETADFDSYSSSYYATATRTAATPAEDCAWVTTIPDELTEKIWDNLDQVIVWGLMPGSLKGLMDAVKDCMGDIAGLGRQLGRLCIDEWVDFANDIELPQPTSDFWDGPAGMFIGQGGLDGMVKAFEDLISGGGIIEDLLGEGIFQTGDDDDDEDSVPVKPRTSASQPTPTPTQTAPPSSQETQESGDGESAAAGFRAGTVVAAALVASFIGGAAVVL